MSNHLYNIVRPLKKTIEFMQEKYQQGRDAGFTVAKAKRYASHCAERQRQDSSGYRGVPHTYRDWFGSNNVEITYDRLVLGRKLPVGYEAAAAEGWKRLIADPKWGPKAVVVLENVGTIFNQDPEIMQACRTQIMRGSGNNGVFIWASIKRGSDLFWKGMGGFDINRAMAICVGLVPKAIGLMKAPPLLPDPTFLAAVGYMVKAGVGIEIEEEIAVYPNQSWYRKVIKDELLLCWRQEPEWVQKHWKWFMGNLTRLDEFRYLNPYVKQQMFGWQNERKALAMQELPWLANAFKINVNRTPEANINQLAINWDRLRDWERAQYEKANPSKPPRLYESKLPVLKSKVGTIRPIEGTKQLKEVGNALHNCAGGYDDDIKEGKLELVCLWSETGKPLALAELKLRKNGNRALQQLSGPCNQPVDAEVAKVFNKYLTYKV